MIINKILILLLVIFIIIFFILINKENFKVNRDVHFIHIPKNAGRTIKVMYPQFNKGGNHYDALPQESKINIAIIRNPYYRFLSIFAHLKEKGSRNDNTRCDDLDNFNNVETFVDAYFDKNHKYHTKVKQLLTWKKSDFNIIKNKHLEGSRDFVSGGCVLNYKCMHWAPQSLFIEDSSKVQYLLKFENLDKDLEILQKKGILKKKKLEHINKSIYTKKKEITPKIKKLVDEVYSKDLELWNKCGL